MSFEQKSFKLVKDISTKKRKAVTFISNKSHPNCLDDVIDNDLCCGCGTCVGACPYNILDIDLGNIQNPYLVADCTECTICSQACPALEVDLFSVREKAKEQGINIDPTYGSYIDFSLGYHTNETKRSNSASGGVATAILEYMLDTKQVECVVIVGMNNEFPEVRVVRNSKDIAQSQQSKYGYVPLGVVWTELRKTKETFAFVGLPCHISGFNNTANIYKNLKKQCKLKIGLFCGYSQTYDNIDFFKHRADAKDGKFKGWREGKYPGGVHIDDKLIPLQDFLSTSIPFFTMQRCFHCEDGLAEEADIVLGDSHNSGDDMNMILTRTHLGANILNKCQKLEYIKYNYISKEDADQGTIGGVATAKNQFAYSLNKTKKTLHLKSVDFKIDKNMSKKIFFLGVAKSTLYLFSSRYIVKWFGFKKFLDPLGLIIYRFPWSLKLTKKNRELLKSIYKGSYIDYK